MQRKDMVTRGPAGKGFDESLGMLPEDLDAMVTQLIEHATTTPPATEKP